MADDAARLIRTDFNDDTSWEALVDTTLIGNADGFAAVFDLVENPDFEGASAAQLAEEFPDEPVLYVADEHAMGDQSWEILVHHPDSGIEFRVRAQDIWMIENNLSMGKMDLDDMLEQVGEDGVFVAETPLTGRDS